MTERATGEGAARDVDGACAAGRRGDQAGIAAWLDAPARARPRERVACGATAAKPRVLEPFQPVHGRPLPARQWVEALQRLHGVAAGFAAVPARARPRGRVACGAAAAKPRVREAFQPVRGVARPLPARQWVEAFQRAQGVAPGRSAGGRSWEAFQRPHGGAAQFAAAPAHTCADAQAMRRGTMPMPRESTEASAARFGERPPGAGAPVSLMGGDAAPAARRLAPPTRLAPRGVPGSWVPGPP